MTNNLKSKLPEPLKVTQNNGRLHYFFRNKTEADAFVEGIKHAVTCSKVNDLVVEF